jgi:hypothetical protein
MTGGKKIWLGMIPDCIPGIKQRIRSLLVSNIIG